MARESDTDSDRAFRAWQVLVEVAANRQPVPYFDLACKARIPRPNRDQNISNWIASWLNPIARYCARKNLPCLPVLAVSGRTKIPGNGLTEFLPREQWDSERCKVCAFDWKELEQPRPEDFAEVDI